MVEGLTCFRIDIRQKRVFRKKMHLKDPDNIGVFLFLVNNYFIIYNILVLRLA